MSEKTNIPMTPEVAVEVLTEAERLMRVPHAVVTKFMAFATDEEDESVEYGDPAACRFCVAGVVGHAIYNLYGTDAQLDYRDEHVLVAGPNSPPCWKGLVDVFADSWESVLPTDDKATPEQAEAVRQNVLRSLSEMKARWA